jgi:outer membrane protein assembly factor BamB
MDMPLVLMNRATVTGLDPASGRALWKFECDFKEGEFMRLVLDGTRALVFTDRGIHCLDAGTGKSLGFVATGMAPSTIFKQGDRVFCAGVNGAFCVTTSGQMVWQNVDDVDIKVGAPALGLGSTVVQGDFE